MNKEKASIFANSDFDKRFKSCLVCAGEGSDCYRCFEDRAFENFRLSKSGDEYVKLVRKNCIELPDTLTNSEVLDKVFGKDVAAKLKVLLVKNDSAMYWLNKKYDKSHLQPSLAKQKQELWREKFLKKEEEKEKLLKGQLSQL